MRRVWTAVATLLTAFCGCGRSGELANDSVAVAVPTDHVLMKAATDKARATVDEFKKAVTHPTPEQTDFSVKAEINDNGAVHCLWLQQVACSGPITGRVRQLRSPLTTFPTGCMSKEKSLWADSRFGQSEIAFAARNVRRLRKACGSNLIDVPATSQAMHVIRGSVSNRMDDR